MAALLMCGVIVLSLLVLPSSPLIVKADGESDFVQTIYTYIESGQQFSFGPVGGSAITAIGLLAVTVGAAFSSKGQLETFAAGYNQWISAHGLSDQAYLSNLQTIGNQMVYTFNPSAVQQMKAYVQSIKINPATVNYIGYVGTYTCPVSTGAWKSIDLSGINYIGLNSTAIYFLSWGSFRNSIAASITFSFNASDSSRSYGSEFDIGVYMDPSVIPAGTAQLKISIDSAGYMSMTDLVGNVRQTTNAAFSAVGYQPISSAVLPLSVNLHIQNLDRDYPVSLTLDRDLISNDYGNLTGIDEGVNSKNSTAVLDGTRPADVTVPANPTYGDVIGKTAADTSTTVTTDTGTTTGDTTAEPDWTKPGTKSIDWGPLTNLYLFDKFPFCLPWDLKNMVAGLVANPVAPHWDFDIPMSGLHLPDFAFSVDFSQYEPVVLVIRWGILAAVTVGLIFGAYKLIKH
jgi:hypothetical protein